MYVWTGFTTMRNSIQIICLVVIVTYGCFVETKPNDGSVKTKCDKCAEAHEELYLKLNGKIENQKNLTSVKDDKCEIPVGKVPHVPNLLVPDTLGYIVAKSIDATRVNDDPQDFDNSKCGYEQPINSSMSQNRVGRKKRATKFRKLKLLKIKSIRSKQVEDIFSIGHLGNHQPRKIIKRSSMNNCSISVTDGYVCRCVPQDEQDSLFGENQAEQNPAGTSLDDQFEVGPVNVGGDAISVIAIQEQLAPLLEAVEDGSMTEEIVGFAELLAEVSQSSPEPDYSVLMKYGTIVKEHEENSLRTYDIEPEEGVYEGTPMNEMNTMAIRMLGDFVSIFTNAQQQRPSRLQSFLQSRREMREQFMNYFNSDGDRKRRSVTR